MTGDTTLVSTITSATPGNNCPSGGTDSRCDTSVTLTEATDLTFDKDASTASVAQGAVVTYTITISNSGLTPYVGAKFTDSLAGVLDDATYNGDAAASMRDRHLHRAQPDLDRERPGGGSTTVTYSVTANVPDAGDEILSDTLVSDSANGNCAAASTDPRCTVTVTLADLDAVLTSAAPTVLPGGVVRYTTVITNTGQTAYNGISVLFERANTADDAISNGDQTATSGSLSLGLTGAHLDREHPGRGQRHHHRHAHGAQPRPGRRACSPSRGLHGAGQQLLRDDRPRLHRLRHRADSRADDHQDRRQDRGGSGGRGGLHDDDRQQRGDRVHRRDRHRRAGGRAGRRDLQRGRDGHERDGHLRGRDPDLGR